MRKASTIRKDLGKAQIELDRAQRAVFALSGRTDVRLCDIIAANLSNILVEDYRLAASACVVLHDELRNVE